MGSESSRLKERIEYASSSSDKISIYVSGYDYMGNGKCRCLLCGTINFSERTPRDFMKDHLENCSYMSRFGNIRNYFKKKREIEEKTLKETNELVEKINNRCSEIFTGFKETIPSDFDPLYMTMEHDCSVSLENVKHCPRLIENLNNLLANKMAYISVTVRCSRISAFNDRTYYSTNPIINDINVEKINESITPARVSDTMIWFRTTKYGKKYMDDLIKEEIDAYNQAKYEVWLQKTRKEARKEAQKEDCKENIVIIPS